MSPTFNAIGKNIFFLESSEILSDEQKDAVIPELFNAFSGIVFGEQYKSKYIYIGYREDLSRDSLSEITSEINNKLSKFDLKAVASSSQIYGVTITKINESEKNESKALNNDKSGTEFFRNILDMLEEVEKSGDESNNSPFALNFNCELNKGVNSENIAQCLLKLNGIMKQISKTVDENSEIEIYINAAEVGSIQLIGAIFGAGIIGTLIGITINIGSILYKPEFKFEYHNDKCDITIYNDTVTVASDVARSFEKIRSNRTIETGLIDLEQFMNNRGISLSFASSRERKLA